MNSCYSNKKQTTKVAVCASSYLVLDEIKKLYETKTGNEIELIQGASGRLTTQIIQGAPYDIFISADLSFSKLVQEKLELKNYPKVLTKNQLALWKKSDETPLTVALANPKTAPFGRLAKKELGLLNINVQEVFGESISQVNHYILSESVDWAYTSYSSIRNNPKLRGTLTLVSGSPVLNQGVICLSEDEQTQLFFTFLFSKESKGVFTKHGYLE